MSPARWRLTSLRAQIASESKSAVPEGTPEVRGYDFNKGVDYDALFKMYKTMGFQATNLSLAIDEINRMVAKTPCFERSAAHVPCCVLQFKWRLSDEAKKEDEDDTDEDGKPIDRSKVRLRSDGSACAKG